MIYDSQGSLDDLAEKVRATTEALKPHRKQWDSIAVRGMSGALVGAPVSLRLRLPLVVIRKPGENAHSSSTVVNARNVGKRVLFLDDFVGTGATRTAVRQAVENLGGSLVAQYEYTHPWDGVQDL